VETIVRLTDATIGQQGVIVLREVNMEVARGEFVYVVGRVGSGKSTLLRTLYAELPLLEGYGEVAGFSLVGIRRSRVPRLRRKCSIVFQDFRLLTDRSARANLEFVLRATGWKRKAARERAGEVLEQVGMPDAIDKFPHQLSGGEQQRVVLARALLNSPPVILADEPTGNIDPETSYRLLELLKEIAGKGTAVIIATHQYDLIERYPGRVFRCEGGRLIEEQVPDGQATRGDELTGERDNATEPCPPDAPEI
jgi:cell division transport system ATP-binding protein